jgi:hypothetical protein
MPGNEADRHLMRHEFPGEGIADNPAGAQDRVDRSRHLLKYYGIKIIRIGFLL